MGFAGSASASLAVTTTKVPTRLVVARPAIELSLARLARPVRLAAVLTRRAAGSPVIGQTVTFSAGGRTLHTGITDLAGLARCDVGLAALVPITRSGGVVASFGGTTTLEATTAASPTR